MDHLTKKDGRLLNRADLPANQREVIEDAWKETPKASQTLGMHLKNFCGYFITPVFIAIFIASTIPMEFPIERIKDVLLVFIWVLYPFYIIFVVCLSALFIFLLYNLDEIVENVGGEYEKFNRILTRILFAAIFPNFIRKFWSIFIPITLAIAIGYAGHLVTCGLILVSFILVCFFVQLFKGFILGVVKRVAESE